MARATLLRRHEARARSSGTQEQQEVAMVTGHSIVASSIVFMNTCMILDNFKSSEN